MSGGSRQPAAIVWTGSTESYADGTCSTCRELVATLEATTIGVVASLHDDDEDATELTLTENRVIGWRVELAAGLVNRGQRHASGHPWYGRGRRQSGRAERRVRLPAVVTCSRGHDTLVDRVDPTVGRWANASARGREAELARELDEDSRLAHEWWDDGGPGRD